MNVISVERIRRLYKGADETLTARIEKAVDLVNEAADPKEMTAHFEVGEDLLLGDFCPAGNDIRKHLEGATAVVVGVCTLGANVDRLLETLQVKDLATAYIADIAASYAVENLAESIWQRLKAEAESRGETCTTRYSPGYGDFDLGGQKDLLRIAGADKALNVRVNDGGMMYPSKTITFLVGVVPKP